MTTQTPIQLPTIRTLSHFQHADQTRRSASEPLMKRKRNEVNPSHPADTRPQPPTSSIAPKSIFPNEPIPISKNPMYVHSCHSWPSMVFFHIGTPDLIENKATPPETEPTGTREPELLPEQTSAYILAPSPQIMGLCLCNAGLLCG